jgi:anti-anti-sigma regulatory factor
MNSSQFKQIEQFFDTMPRLSHELKVTNPNTKVESTVVLEGLSSFFA